MGRTKARCKKRNKRAKVMKLIQARRREMMNLFLNSSQNVPKEVHITNFGYRDVPKEAHMTNFDKLKIKADQPQHDNLQKHLHLENIRTYSRVIRKSNIKAKTGKDEQDKNNFDKGRGQSQRTILERSEIKIEVVEHDIKEEVLQGDFINSKPKLSTNNPNDAIKNLNLTTKPQHDNFQRHLHLENIRTYSRVIRKSNIKAETEKDEQNKNNFHKDRGQYKSVLKRSEIKIEVVEHDLKEEVLQGDFINSKPKLSTNNPNDAIKNLNLTAKPQHDNLQRHLHLENIRTYSRVMRKSNIKSETENDEQNKNNFDKDRGQSKSVLERSGIKIEVVEHEMKEEVLQDDLISSKPKLNTDNANVAIKISSLLNEGCRPFEATCNEAPSIDTECNENFIKTEFVECESAHDADNYYFE